jgi:hypothetical protein
MSCPGIRSAVSGVVMTETNAAGTGRDARRCPSCGTPLDATGAGGDELLECSHCGLAMFDARRT